MPVSASGLVYIRVLYRAFHALKQAISRAETVHFVG